jgi:short-subunit dehydrogenase
MEVVLMSEPRPASAACDTGHALVTGASSGIGAAIAREYAHRGIPLILSARRVERLEALADELRARVDVVVLAADLADPHAPAALEAAVRERGLHVSHLVNNAGYSVPGRFLANPWSAHADVLQVMITAVCELSHRFLPAMQARGYGRILNVASVAGLAPASAGDTLYGTAKGFVIRFSEALAQETRRQGIHVCALCPGFTRSEFHDANGTRAQADKIPSWMWQDAATVARQGVDAVEQGRTRVITGTANRVLIGVLPHIPRSLIRTLAGTAMRVRRLFAPRRPDIRPDIRNESTRCPERG